MATPGRRGSRGVTAARATPARAPRSRGAPALWHCPRCGRTFRQANQAHSCGVGSRAALLAGKDDDLVALYRKLEAVVRALPGSEIVMRGRYALFRTTRIYADLVFMKEALRLALLLDREAGQPLFFKVGRMSKHRVAHVALIRSDAELRAVLPWLREAHAFARGEDAPRPAARRPRA